MAKQVGLVLNLERPNRSSKSRLFYVMMPHTPMPVSSLTPNYNRFPVSFTHGEGVWLFGQNGEKYLDFAGGIAVSALGHAYPALVSALSHQAQKVLHLSNLYEIPQAEKTASLLVKHSFADQVLFTNSGAEANEALVKMMRRAHYCRGNQDRTEIITFSGAFHGRTLAMLSATGNPKYQEGFGEMPSGFRHAVFNDLNSVKQLLSEHTAGILIEPIQGESGITPAHQDFLKALRTLCDQEGIFLGLDEVQSGVGRTGKFFAYAHFGIEPDLVSLAKGLGGGIPIGAVLVRKEIGAHLTAGTHGSTFAGGPFACTAAQIVLNEIFSKGFLDKVTKTGLFLSEALQKLTEDFPEIFVEQRGVGLMQGLRCKKNVSEIAKACLKERLLAVPAGNNVLRLLPPLIVTEEECLLAVEKLRKLAQNSIL